MQTPSRGSCNFDEKRTGLEKKLQQTSGFPLNRITEANVRSGRGSGTMTPVRGTRITKTRVLASYFSSLNHSGIGRTTFILFPRTRNPPRKRSIVISKELLNLPVPRSRIS